MIGMIVYLLGCTAVALVLTFLYVIMRPVNSRDELKSWRVLSVFFVLSITAPYIWAEVWTRLVGQNMEHAVNQALDDANIDGDLRYYKVIYYNGKTARVVAVANGKANWGGTDHPVVAVTLDKAGEKWKVASYRVVSSFNMNEDGFTFPPYY